MDDYYYQRIYELATKQRIFQQAPWWNNGRTDWDDIIKYAEAKVREAKLSAHTIKPCPR